MKQAAVHTALRCSRAVQHRRAAKACAVATDSLSTVDVDLGDRTYPIYIGADLLARPELLTDHIRGKRVLIVTNETIAPLYLDRCEPIWQQAGHAQMPCGRLSLQWRAVGAAFVGLQCVVHTSAVCAVCHTRLWTTSESADIPTSALCRVTQALQNKCTVDSVVLQDGEQFKSMDEIQKIWTKALQMRLDRGTLHFDSC